MSTGTLPNGERLLRRGFACIALDGPKDVANVGGVLRAAHCLGASLVVIGKERFRKAPTDTTKAWRHIPMLRVADVFDAVPYNCVPVAVEILPGATPLPEYEHPQQAFYIFGGEDATLGERITSHCRDVIVVPSVYCLNLAAAVNVVLYDRWAKGVSDAGRRAAPPVSQDKTLGGRPVTAAASLAEIDRPGGGSPSTALEAPLPTADSSVPAAGGPPVRAAEGSGPQGTSPELGEGAAGVVPILAAPDPAVRARVAEANAAIGEMPAGLRRGGPTCV